MTLRYTEAKTQSLDSKSPELKSTCTTSEILRSSLKRCEPLFIYKTCGRDAYPLGSLKLRREMTYVKILELLFLTFVKLFWLSVSASC